MECRRENMRILVTGGAGYIGSVMVPMLLNIGHKVIVVDNFMYGQASLLDCCHNRYLEIVRGDVRDEKLMAELVPKVDCIFPLAAIVGASACNQDPTAATSINLEAIRLILKLRSKNQKIVYPNTNSGYGIGQEGIYCTEETPLNPISLYGRSKVQAELEVLSSGYAVALRLGTVAGTSPRMRLDLMVNDFVHRALTDRFVVLFEANFKRNFLHVRDAVKAFIHTINNFNRMSGEAYNVGLSDANMNKLELCQEIKKQIPDFYFYESAIGQDPDKRNYIVSNAKIEKTGFKAMIPLSVTITELIKGLQIVQPRQFRNS